MPRLKLISAERNRGGVARTFFDKHLGQQIVVLTFDGRLYGGGGDLVWIAPVCTIMKYRPESPAPRAPPKSRKGGKPKGSKPGKRPPATPRPGGEAA